MALFEGNVETFYSNQDAQICRPRTFIMTGEGVEVSKVLARDEQHPNVRLWKVRLWKALPSATLVHLCVCVRTCERRGERRKQRQRQREAKSVFVCFVGIECVTLVFALSHAR
jgi:hypothetical protein